MSTVLADKKGLTLTIYLWSRKEITINLFGHAIPNDESRFYCLTLFVFRVWGVTINAVSSVAIVDVIVADVFAAIITVDVYFLAIAIDINNIGVAVTAISADCVSLVFVINVVVFNVAVVFVVDVLLSICYCW